jgi:hypothetical protein
MASGSGDFALDSNGSGSFAKFRNANKTVFRIDPVGNVRANIGFGTGGTSAVCHDTAGVASNSLLFDCNGGAGDLAENFGTTDSSVEAGDVVMFTGEAVATISNGAVTSKAWIAKASRSYDPELLGVISTQPNQLYAEDGVFKPEENPRPVTLVGRVPVKVNLQNGPIKTGDRLTSSNVAGIAMKATEPGQTIGVALNSLDAVSSGSYGTVIVFINPGFWVPTSTASGSGTASTSIEFVYGGMSMDTLFQAVVSKFADIFHIVFEDGILRVANIISDKLTSKELCLEDVCLTRDQLKALLDASGVPQQTTPESQQAPSPTPTPTVSELPTPTPTESPLLTESPSPSPLASSSPSPIPSETPSPTPESTPTPSATPEPTPELTPTPTPISTPTPEPTPSPTPEITPTPEVTPEL